MTVYDREVTEEQTNFQTLFRSKFELLGQTSTNHLAVNLNLTSQALHGQMFIQFSKFVYFRSYIRKKTRIKRLPHFSSKKLKML